MIEAYARGTDPSTSHEAARRIKRIPALEGMVLRWLIRRGVRGGTSAECAADTGLPRVTVSPRFKPLAKKNVIEDSGERRGSSIVWRVVE